MYDFALSAMADAHRADLLREVCAHRRAATVSSRSLASRLMSMLPSVGARTEPCPNC